MVAAAQTMIYVRDYPSGATSGADLDAPFAGVGEAGLLGGLGLELLATAALGVGVELAGWGDQVGGAALEPAQRGAGEDLLLGGRALGAAAAEERRPASAGRR